MRYISKLFIFLLRFYLVSSVNVKFNNDRAWDFTNPNLPTGDGNMRGSGGSSGGNMAGSGMMGAGGMNMGNGGGMMGAGGMNMGNGGMGSGGGMAGGMGGGMSMGNNQMMGAQGQFGGGSSGGSVLLVSNLDEDSVNGEF